MYGIILSRFYNHSRCKRHVTAVEVAENVIFGQILNFWQIIGTAKAKKKLWNGHGVLELFMDLWCVKSFSQNPSASIRSRPKIKIFFFKNCTFSFLKGNFSHFTWTYFDENFRWSWSGHQWNTWSISGKFIEKEIKF